MEGTEGLWGGPFFGGWVSLLLCQGSSGSPATLELSPNEWPKSWVLSYSGPGQIWVCMCLGDSWCKHASLGVGCLEVGFPLPDTSSTCLLGQDGPGTWQIL